MGKVVGARELRQYLSRYLAEVKEGEGFTVTERGRKVARLTPGRTRFAAWQARGGARRDDADG